MKEHLISAIAVLGVAGFFAYQSHQDKVAQSPSYEGNQAAIAKPIKDLPQSRLCDVTKVSDGDTINVNCSGEKLRIRFCGIDAPEKAQALGRESTELMAKLVNGKQVYVSAIESDRYGRTVAEVEAKGTKRNDKGELINTFVNGEMVRAGLAYHYKQYSGNCPNRDVIVDAEKFAQGKKIGVWDGGNYQKPWDYRKANR